MSRVLGRLILVPLGFILGLMAAAAMLLTVGIERFTHAKQGRDIDAQSIGQIFDLMRDFSSLASAATIVPALLLVIIGEVGRIRSAIYYILGGGLALAAVPFLARSGSLGRDFSAVGLIWQVFATAGFVGGAVYWLIAGRRT